MINKPTVFVLGAGASMDYGFPSGATLIDDILTQRRIEELAAPRNGYLTEDRPFAREHVEGFLTDLAAANPYSIDAFLRTRQEYLDVGKAAIALHIGAHENAVHLDRRSFKENGRENWYAELFHRFMAADFDSLQANQVTFVTFNYDRSLEQFLFNSIRATFGKPHEDVAKVLQSIMIYHVHGTLGPLTWQTPPGEAAWSRDYSPITTDDALKAAKHIDVAWNRRQDGTYRFQFLWDDLREAEHVYFLGFGYHPDNMTFFRELFQSRQEGSKQRIFIGTSYRLTAAQCRDVSGRNGHLDVRHNSGTVLEFLRSCPEVLSIVK